MYHKPFFSLPAWREPFSTVPRCQLITFCTYQKEETLGKVLRYQGQHIWRPTAWGMAATRALKAMQRNNQIAIIKEFTVMPNHIHLFIFYKKFHPACRNGSSKRPGNSCSITSNRPATGLSPSGKSP